MTSLFSSVLGCCFVCTSILDGLKYHWNASKIRDVKTSKGHSRQFINVALLNDVVRMAYGFSVQDWYIVISSLLALFFMIELFWTIYTFYPFYNKGRFGYKRPGLLKYFINSVLPNKYAKHL